MFTSNESGPDYTITSAALQKFRAGARKGLRTWDRDMRQAYGAAVEQAVLSAQRSQCKRHGEVMPAPRCASGTWHTTGEEIERAIRSRQNAALLAYPAKARRERTPDQWRAMYAEAMKIKAEYAKPPHIVREHRKPKRLKRAA